MRKIFIIFTMIVAFGGFVNAQNAGFQMHPDSVDMSIHNRLYVSLYGGLTQFYGDVSSDVYFPGSMMKGKIPWSVSPRLGWDWNSRFGLRADLNFNSIWAKDDVIDIYFHSNIFDAQGQFVINVTNLVFPYRYNKRWNMTAFAGAGWMFFNSIARNSSDSILAVVGYDLNGNKTKRESERVWSAGFSGAYKLTRHLDLGLEVKLNNSPTDKIDGIKHVLSEFDNYSSVMLGLTYYFGKNEQEWKWNPYEPIFVEILDSIQSYNDEIEELDKKIDKLQKCCESTDPNAADDDGDGVPNVKDLEPKTPKGNTVNWQGITIMPNNPSNVPVQDPKDFADDDNDGVPNLRDLEPNTPKGNLVNWQGITIPVGVAGTGQGTTGTTGTTGQPKIGMYFNSVYFPFDKSTIDQTNYQEIIKVAMYLRANPGTRIKISGNTDIRGTNQYNDALSDRRVQAVKKILLEDFGFTSDIFDEEALGENKVFSQTTHWVNRRVDFFIVK